MKKRQFLQFDFIKGVTMPILSGKNFFATKKQTLQIELSAFSVVKNSTSSHKNRNINSRTC